MCSVIDHVVDRQKRTGIPGHVFTLKENRVYSSFGKLDIVSKYDRVLLSFF